MAKIPQLNSNTQASGNVSVANVQGAGEAQARAIEAGFGAAAAGFKAAENIVKLRRDRNESNQSKLDTADFLQQVSSPENRKEYLQISPTGTMEGYSGWALKKFQGISEKMLGKYQSPKVRDKLSKDLLFHQNKSFLKFQGEEVADSRRIQKEADQTSVSTLVQSTDQLELDGLGDAEVNAEVNSFTKDIMSEVDSGTRSLGEAKDLIRSASDLVFLRRTKALAENGNAQQAIDVATKKGLFSSPAIAQRALDAAKSSSINSLQKAVKQSNLQEALIRNQRAAQGRQYALKQNELSNQFLDGQIDINQLGEGYAKLNKDFAAVADIAKSNRYRKGTVEQNLAKFKARASVLRADGDSTIDELQEQMSEMSLVLNNKDLHPQLVSLMTTELKKTQIEIAARKKKTLKDAMNESFFKARPMIKKILQSRLITPSKSNMKDHFNEMIANTEGDFEDPNTVRKAYFNMLKKNKDSAQLGYKTSISDSFKGLLPASKVDKLLSSGDDEQKITNKLLKALESKKVFSKYLDEKESFWVFEGEEKRRANEALNQAKKKVQSSVSSYFETLELLKDERSKIKGVLAGD